MTKRIPFARAPRLPVDAGASRGGLSEGLARWPIRPSVAAALALYVLTWMGFLTAIRVTGPELIHGAVLSDADVWNAGRVWDRDGMARHAGLPVLETGLDAEGEASLYGTYPPGPFWIHQAAKALGFDSLGMARIPPLTASTMALCLVFFLALRLTGSDVVGLFSAFFFSFNAVFAGYADSLHQMSYSQVTLLAGVLCWICWETEQGRRRRRLWLAAMASSVFIDLWLTLEHVGFFAVFFCGRLLLARDRLRLVKGLAAFAGTVLFALSTRAIHNLVGYAGPDQLLRELQSKLELRAGLGADQVALLAVARRFAVRLGFGDPSSGDPQLEFSFALLVPWVLVPALALMLLCWWRKSELRTTAAARALVQGTLMLVAGSHWLVIMRQHAWIHRHTVQLLVPGLALVLAGVVACGVEGARSARHRNGRRRWAFILLTVALILGFSQRLVCSEAWSRAFASCGYWIREVSRREARAEQLRAAGVALEGASLAHAAPAWHGDIGAMLGLPFQYWGVVEPPNLRPTEVLFIELRYQERRRPGRIVSAAERFGLPRFIPLPGSAAIVFTQGRVDGTMPARACGERLTVDSLSVEPQLVGGGYVAAIQFSNLAEAPGVCPDLEVEALPGSRPSVAGDGDCLRDSDLGLVWRFFDSTVEPESLLLRLRIENREVCSFGRRRATSTSPSVQLEDGEAARRPDRSSHETPSLGERRGRH